MTELDPRVEEVRHKYRYRNDGNLLRVVKFGKPCEPYVPYTTTNNSGYFHVNLGGTRVGLHVAIWVYHNLKWPPKELTVDHIDRNKLNNRIENLRLLTVVEQKQNVRLHPHNSSGVRNVCFHRPSGLWRVVFQYNGRSQTRYFKTWTEAVANVDPLVDEIANRCQLLTDDSDMFCNHRNDAEEIAVFAAQ